jgi:hypothetical protein
MACEDLQAVRPQMPNAFTALDLVGQAGVQTMQVQK